MPEAKGITHTGSFKFAERVDTALRPVKLYSDDVSLLGFDDWLLLRFELSSAVEPIRCLAVGPRHQNRVVQFKSPSYVASRETELSPSRSQAKY